MQLEPIGTVKSPVKDASTASGWGQVTAEIVINPELADGLKGIEDWSHVIVIFVMHEVDFNPEQHLVHRPAGREDMPEVGVFAQRSRSRPNRIGITAVRVTGVEGNVLKVKGLDAIDGTPVLDIKPYAPVYDGAQDPEVPIWFFRLMQDYF